MFKLYWEREDGQGETPCGEYSTWGEAEAAIPSAYAELVEQCGEPSQRAEIERGTWFISVPDDKLIETAYREIELMGIRRVFTRFKDGEE